MSVVFKLEESVFLDHLAVTQKWYRLKGDNADVLWASNPQTNHSSQTTQLENVTQVFTPKQVVGYRMKFELFAIESPFMMESQIERLKKKAALDSFKMKETSADRKRKKRLQKAMNNFKEEKIFSLLKASMTSLILKARSENYLSIESSLYERNHLAQTAATLHGCGDLFQQLWEELDENSNWNLNHLTDLQDLDTTIEYSAQSFIGRCVRNNLCKILTLDKNKFIIPDRSVFLTSSYDYFITKGYQQILTPKKFDLIVIDPPWKNKSVKRKKSYNTFNEESLKKLPMQKLCHENSFICVWVTNNEQFINFVKYELFPGWCVQWKADWLWMKVTKSGVPICEVNSHHKKPYEHLIIGQYNPHSHNLSLVTTMNSRGDNSQQNILDRILLNTDTMKVEQDSVLESVKVSSVEKNEIDEDIKEYHCINSTEEEKERKEKSLNELPNPFLLVSIPCSLHSKKPPLSEVLLPYLSKNPVCIELFARNLVPGWTSWGNEPLRHQHLDYFEAVLQ